ncbi:MAG: DUF58 domain-containing protein [Opitutales bacterium]
MANGQAELKHWHDWTDPDFFVEERHTESRLIPLFLRQLLPGWNSRTKLTLTGWFLIVIALGIGLAAYNTASNILFMTLSLLLSSLVLSGILSVINFRMLDWKLKAPDHLRVGETGVVSVALRNMKKRFPTIGIFLRMESSLEDRSERIYMKNSLEPATTRQLEWKFEPQRRGFCVLRLAGLESQFPFGFLLRQVNVSAAAETYVWPRRILYRFVPQSAGRRHTAGDVRRQAGTGSDLLNLRSYQQGDPLRLIHWKATARLRKLMIRQLAQEGEAGYHLVVDPDARKWTETEFEKLCSLACSLGEDLFHAGRLESFAIVGEAPAIVRGRRDLETCFNQLALLERIDQDRAGALPGGGMNRISFRAGKDDEVIIYVDGHEAGTTDG